MRQGLEDLGHDVLGRDEVDVVAADRLQLEHHLGEAHRAGALAAYVPGDVVVLAEDAAQVAAREEDRARAAPAAKAVLLAEVREVRGDDGAAADRAQALLVDAAVDLAAPRADDAARPEELEGLLGTPGGGLPTAAGDLAAGRLYGQGDLPQRWTLVAVMGR